MKRRKAPSANLLIVGIFTLLAVGSWVIFDVYRALTNTTITEVLQKDIEPLKANLTQELLRNLRTRRQFDATALSRVQPYLGSPTASGEQELVSVLPGTEAPLTTEEASGSAEGVTVTEEATSSAEEATSSGVGI